MNHLNTIKRIVAEAAKAATKNKKTIKPDPKTVKVNVAVDDNDETAAAANQQPIPKSVTESIEGVAVVAFGRLNPPTIGHELMIRRMVAVARQVGSTEKPRLYLSQTQDKASNPLNYAQKSRLVTKAFGRDVQVIVDPSIRTFIDVPKSLSGRFARLVVVAGSDRVGEFKRLLDKYNGRDYAFATIDVVSAGERDPDADGATGMSASRARAFAVANDLDSFRQAMPTRVQSDAKSVMDAIRTAMKVVTEDEDLDEALTLQARMKRRMAMNRLKAVIRAARKRSLRRRADGETLKRRARRRARDMIRQRILKTVNYQDLPLAARSRVDALVAKRRKVVARIAQRMLPKLRRAEMSRKLGTTARLPAAGQPGGAPRPAAENHVVLRAAMNFLSEQASVPMHAVLIQPSLVSLYEAWCLTRGIKLDPKQKDAIRKEGLLATATSPGKRAGEWVVESDSGRFVIPEYLADESALVAATSHLRTAP